ncbi:MAG: hypothetical protein OSB41_16005 [Kiritimatiellae bacterium]|nr:hypothetical protein [Kiritimatiellia bacterium]
MVDSEGHRLWLHQASSDPSKSVEFYGASATANGGVLLCGSEDTAPGYRHAAGADHQREHNSLLLRLAKDGSEISLQRLSMAPPTENIFLLLQRVVHWGTGFAVVGLSYDFSSSDPPIQFKTFITILKLDRDGKIEWRNNYPSKKDNIDSFAWPVVMADGSLVIAGDRIFKTVLLRVAQDGKLLARASFEEPYSLVTPARPESHIELVSDRSEGRMLVRMDENLHVESRTKLPFVGIDIKRTLRTADGGLALFGRQLGTSGGPALAYLENGQSVAALALSDEKAITIGFSDAEPMMDSTTFAAVHAADYRSYVAADGRVANEHGKEELVLSLIKVSRQDN